LAIAISTRRTQEAQVMPSIRLAEDETDQLSACHPAQCAHHGIPERTHISDMNDFPEHGTAEKSA